MRDEITRRQFLGSTAGLGIALATSDTFAATEQPPNIILLMGDDHGWDETGYNGHPHLKTPVLDEMAATGLRLDRFYAAAPVCSPTRASVMTGRHPNRCGTFTPGWSTRPEEIGIARLLSDAGYTCGHFGKWHLGPVKAESPTNPGALGFDEWLSHDNFFEMDPHFSRNGGPPQQYKGESSEILIDETNRFIDRAKQQGKPFFAVVWFGSPHEPYSGLEKDLALYDNLPASYKDQTVRLTSMETGRPTERPLDEVLRERYAEITAMDRAIGQLRSHLGQEDLRENTLLWYCGDNGSPREGSVTSPLRGRKGQMYEGGVRVPGVIEWPARINAPRTSSVNTVTSDILPTLCELAEQPVPSRPIDGISLDPLLAGQMTERVNPICFWRFDTSRERDGVPYIDPELQKGTTPLVKLMGDIPTRNFRNMRHPSITEGDYAGTRSILGNRYKLVIDGQEGSGRELFDLRKDPAEEHNLFEAEHETAAQLEKQLTAWQGSVLTSLTGADY
jgi:arylsulfatase A-like enzyme